MNPRILELQHQAMSLVLNGNDPDGDVEKMYIPAEFTKKLAELIVRECANIADGLSKLYPRTDVAFDMGYTMGTTRATKEIKQHFGVEE
jgi:hypothetical protein